MRKVTADVFFEVVGKLNVTVTPKGNYPYRTDFSRKDGVRVGYIQDIDVCGLLVSEYYLD